ncbi:TauD domain-containing protein [Candidatus Protochlamydia naegleriophila]|uniref:TauD domain-containing protein n=2 Tax=Candidatus Protochlamydia naegleriophila TaxID=389348 RepID=A0A0U5JBV3_9BACT|nr:TauD domain-containing protein [Candidatus Protochlamydia naegleriophila]
MGGLDQIKTKLITTEDLPLVIESRNEMALVDLLDLLTHSNSFFKQNLLKHGGLLFRNFPIHNENDFASVIKALGTGKFIDYVGGDSPRTKIKEGIYTSTEAPPSMKIPLHNELSYVKNYPSHIYFYCAVPAQEGGSTILGDARKIYQSINSAVKQRMVDKELLYVSAYYHQSKLMELINTFQKGHKPWKDVFETMDPKEVEKKCLENEISFKWNQHNWLQISQLRPAAISHPETQEKVWFNQAHLFDFNPKLLGWWRYLGTKLLYCREHMRLHQVFFADHSKIPRNDLYHVLDVLDANTLSFPWQKGDLLVLDNVLSMHGRATFKGPRRVLTAMTG